MLPELSKSVFFQDFSGIRTIINCFNPKICEKLFHFFLVRFFQNRLLKKRKYLSLSLINQNKNLVEGHKITLNNIHRGKTTKINGKSVLIYTYETDSSSINLKINEKNCLYEISYTTIANSNPALSS